MAILNGRHAPIILSLLVSLTGCRQLGLAESDQSNLNGVVTAQQFDKSFEIISNLDYIPFEYTRNGCYARALYMAMELAAERIPSTAVFAYPPDMGPPLRTPSGITWIYHVAPMLKIGATGEETVIDPSMRQGSHLPLSRWVAMMQTGEGWNEHLSSGGARITTRRVHGSDYDHPDEGQQDAIPTNFDQLRAFRSHDIQDACVDSHRFLALEVDRPGKVEVRQAKLLSRTRELLASLKRLNKLTQTDGAPNVSCGGEEIDIPSL